MKPIMKLHILLFLLAFFSSSLTAQKSTNQIKAGSKTELKVIVKEDPAEDSTLKMNHFMTEIWEPEIKIIQPGTQISQPPSDAIILFDGTDLNKEWQGRKGSKPQWIIEDGAMISTSGSGGIQTRRVFHDFQLHVEFKTPVKIIGSSQGRGNSGITLGGPYELQILDNYNNRTYRNGQCGSIYKQHAPLVNVCKAPGEWQIYDIIFTAPRFSKDSLTYFTPPRVTVLQNGVLIQNNVELRGPTVYVGIPDYRVRYHGPGPIGLQDHGNPLAFRNIWIREL